MGNFKYSENTINNIMNTYKLNYKVHKVAINGVLSDLKKLKEDIEKLYDDKVFYLSYWENECPFHGWVWSEDDGTMKNMKFITDTITDKFLEIYSLILLGIGLENYKGTETVTLQEDNNG